MKKALLTIGNTLRGDDGVGYALGEQINKSGGWEVFHGEDCPENQINLIRAYGPDIVVIADAVLGLDEGDAQFLDVTNEEMGMFNTHSIPIQYLIQFVQDFCESVLFLGIGVKYEKLLGINMELSDEALGAVDNAVNLMHKFEEIIV
ncbi:MAG TPA: hydrogenase maturation protease [Spirochaetota bacterium]|nr:hydrogenase maturation protease [Spirochaetota bacterium]HPJ36552.1 hydrogenase maturation protease [Spirochaetota bacterium]